MKPHPNFPEVMDLSQVPEREVKPLIDCNGFCGTNDLNKRNGIGEDLNFDDEELI